MRLIKMLAVVATVSSGVVSSADAAISRLLVFGDSLSDGGNVALATGGAIPGSAYFNGRFSNGPLWVDRVAVALGAPVPQPSLLPQALGGPGTNFAVGGSRVNDPAIFLGQAVPSFSSIVGQYLSTEPTIAPDTLVTIWIGSNDLLNLSPTTDISAMATTVKTAMEGLAGRGARQFALLGVAPVGRTPAVATNGAIATAVVNNAARAYNALLAQIPGTIEATVPGSKVTFVDTYSAFDTLLANPAAFGVVNTTDPALTQLGAVPSPNTYLWWDTVHPTARGHQFVAGLTLQAIPEPSSVALLVAPVMAVGLRGRRRA
jgi:phospholipase/lecithinase/hemolysin